MFKDRYSIEEVSRMSGLTTRTIRNYLKDGIVHGTKEDGKWFFDTEDFTKMLESSYVSAAIKAKNNAPVLDFLNEDKKNKDSVCMVIDRIIDEDKSNAFIEDLCLLQCEAEGVEMRLEKKGQHIRIILTGIEAGVREIYMKI